MEAKDYVTFVGILATLMLGVYNAVQNYRTSRRTEFINTVTSERVKWIDKLRQSMSRFCGLAHFWRFSTGADIGEARRVVEEIDQLRHLIVLQLNPGGEIDRRIAKLVGRVAEMSASTEGSTREAYRGTLDELTAATQELLKAEWEKVKAEAKSRRL